MHRRLVGLIGGFTVVLGSLLLGGCGGDGDLPESSGSPVRSGSPVGLRIDHDVEYHSGTYADEEQWSAGLMDVYAPTGAGGLPVVVMYHGGGVGKSYLSGIAAATAQRGAVVFVPSWGTMYRSDDPEDGYEHGLKEVDGAACAASFAIQNAHEYGGDPETLVLFGHSAGANMASVVGLRDAVPLDVCAAEMRPFDAAGLVLWEGDWLAVTTDWDTAAGEGVARVMDASTPWTWLDGDKPPVDLLVTDGAPKELKRCQASKERGWWSLRDPDGVFTAGLEEQGAMDDGCIDVAEGSRLLLSTLQEEGFDARYVELAESTHMTLSPAAQELLVDSIVSIGQR